MLTFALAAEPVVPAEPVALVAPAVPVAAAAAAVARRVVAVVDDVVLVVEEVPIGRELERRWLQLVARPTSEDVAG